MCGLFMFIQQTRPRLPSFTIIYPCLAILGLLKLKPWLPLLPWLPFWCQRHAARLDNINAERRGEQVKNHVFQYKNGDDLGGPIDWTPPSSTRILLVSILNIVWLAKFDPEPYLPQNQNVLACFGHLLRSTYFFRPWHNQKIPNHLSAKDLARKMFQSRTNHMRFLLNMRNSRVSILEGPSMILMVKLSDHFTFTMEIIPYIYIYPRWHFHYKMLALVSTITVL